AAGAAELPPGLPRARSRPAARAAGTRGRAADPGDRGPQAAGAARTIRALQTGAGPLEPRRADDLPPSPGLSARARPGARAGAVDAARGGRRGRTAESAE